MVAALRSWPDGVKPMKHGDEGAALQNFDVLIQPERRGPDLDIGMSLTPRYDVRATLGCDHQTVADPATLKVRPWSSVC